MIVLMNYDKGDVFDGEHGARKCFPLYYRSPHGHGGFPFYSANTNWSIVLSIVVTIPDFVMRYVSRYLGHDAIRIAILVYRVSQCLDLQFVYDTY